jgi:hypothetical protein
MTFAEAIAVRQPVRVAAITDAAPWLEPSGTTVSVNRCISCSRRPKGKYHPSACDEPITRRSTGGSNP